MSDGGLSGDDRLDSGFGALAVVTLGDSSSAGRRIRNTSDEALGRMGDTSEDGLSALTIVALGDGSSAGRRVGDTSDEALGRLGDTSEDRLGGESGASEDRLGEFRDRASGDGDDFVATVLVARGDGDSGSGGLRSRNRSDGDRSDRDRDSGDGDRFRALVVFTVSDSDSGSRPLGRRNTSDEALGVVGDASEDGLGGRKSNTSQNRELRDRAGSDCDNLVATVIVARSNGDSGSGELGTRNSGSSRRNSRTIRVGGDRTSGELSDGAGSDCDGFSALTSSITLGDGDGSSSKRAAASAGSSRAGDVAEGNGHNGLGQGEDANGGKSFELHC